MSKCEIRLTGSGGQGVILATVILAEAAVLSGSHAAQSQAYGPEARGGSCKAEVLISDEEIGFTKVTHPNFLMALTQSSLDKYLPTVSEDCRVLADSSLNVPEDRDVITLPILKTAKEDVGKSLTANIVAVSCINSILGIVPEDTLKEAVLMHVPKGSEALNLKALEAGRRLYENT